MINNTKLYKRGIILDEQYVLPVLNIMNATLPNLINKHLDVCEYVHIDKKGRIKNRWLIRFRESDVLWTYLLMTIYSKNITDIDFEEYLR